MSTRRPPPPPLPPDDDTIMPLGAVATYIGCHRGRIERAVVNARISVCGRGARGQPFFLKRDAKRLKEEFDAEDRQRNEEQ